MLNSSDIYKLLAANGIRVFAVKISNDTVYFIHPSKTVKQWRRDVLSAMSDVGSVRDEHGEAVLEVHDCFMTVMSENGYFEVDDIVSDSFEGEISTVEAIMTPDAESADMRGFGRYGHEAKNEEVKQ